MIQDLNKSGIYKICVLPTNKFYIGSAHIFKRRFLVHKNNLKKNKHGNTILQNAWNKYGEENFVFEIIEYCDKKNCLIREQYYIDTLLPTININKFTGIYIEDLKRTKNTKKLQRQSQLNVSKIKCQWCEKINTPQLDARFHGQYCKKNPNKIEIPKNKKQEKIQCTICNKVVGKGSYKRSHGDNCKLNPNYLPKEKIILICPICSFKGSGAAMKTWHFDNCKQNPNYVKKSKINKNKPRQKVICPHCNKKGDISGMKHYHFDNCKNKITLTPTQL